MLFYICKFLFNYFKFILELFWYIFLCDICFGGQFLLAKYFGSYFLFYPYPSFVWMWPDKFCLFLNVLDFPHPAMTSICMKELYEALS